MLLIVVIGYHSIKDLVKRGLQTTNIAASEKTLIYLSFFLILIYFFAPFKFGSGLYFNERFPLVILLITLPLLRIPETVLFRKFGSILIAGIVSIFFIFNVILLNQQSAKVDKFLSGLSVDLPKGSIVMMYRPKLPEWTTVDILPFCIILRHFQGCVDIEIMNNTDLFPRLINLSARPH
jgi:hypothetical protein